MKNRINFVISQFRYIKKLNYKINKKNTFSPISESISSDNNDSCDALILKSELESSKPTLLM